MNIAEPLVKIFQQDPALGASLLTWLIAAGIFFGAWFSWLVTRELKNKSDDINKLQGDNKKLQDDFNRLSQEDKGRRESLIGIVTSYENEMLDVYQYQLTLRRLVNAVESVLTEHGLSNKETSLEQGKLQQIIQEVAELENKLEGKARKINIAKKIDDNLDEWTKDTIENTINPRQNHQESHLTKKKGWIINS